tara:strand:- start:6595 stop:7863 length:1269 start_codon:yes stop_codon:yes gene_type:complete
MGNSISNIKENTTDVTEYLLKIDSLAAKFVTSSNISNNSKMSDLYYCNDLVIMTGDVLSNKLNSMDIEYLKQRTEKGVVIDDMTNDKVIFFNKSQQDNLDVKNKTEKRRLCNGISKFYVKIAQLYAAILKTINPVFKYKDEHGIEHIVPHNKKSQIPSHLNYSFTQINLCNRRLNALLNSQDYTVSENKDMFVHPELCSFNITPNGKDMNLMDEEGMVEFGQLFKDEYNYDTGKFDNISDKMKQQYKKSLTVFYNTYTGNSGSLPEDIKKFSDIKLRKFDRTECSTDGSFKKKYKGTMSEELFGKYANHLKEMYIKINKNHEAIINILKQIFSIITTTKGEKVIINPKLTYKELDKIIEQTQQLITVLYVSCEEDFLKGISIFQEIVLHQNKITNEHKRENIKDGFEKTLTGELPNEKEVSL